MIRPYYVEIPPHLSDVLADLGGVSPDADFDVIIAAGRAQLFNFSYPISTADKVAFEEWFCNHYIMRRIGSGNVKKWRQIFKNKVLDIMPYYKQLLDSEHIEFEPLLNNDIRTTDDYESTLDTDFDRTESNGYQYTKDGTDHTETGRETEADTSGTRNLVESENYSKDSNGSKTGSKTGNETTSNTEVNRYSDTPQGDSSKIWEIDSQGNPVLTDIYLTDIRGITNNGRRNYTESTTETHTEHEQGTDNKGTEEQTTGHTEQEENIEFDRTWTEKGNDLRNIKEHAVTDTDTTHYNDNYKLGVANESKSELLNKYRETFLRVRQMMAEEFDEIFYNLYEIDDILDYV